MESRHITLVNVRHLQRSDFDIYIGRWHPRFPNEPTYKWGNPYTLKDFTRQQAIDKYEELVRSTPALMASLPELEDKRIGCWCVEKPISVIRPSQDRVCHGEPLIKLVAELQERAQ